MYSNCDLCILRLFPLHIPLHVNLKNILGLAVQPCLPLRACAVPCELLPHLHPMHTKILFESNFGVLIVYCK